MFFAAGNMWDISDETCQLIFYETFHTSFRLLVYSYFWSLHLAENIINGLHLPRTGGHCWKTSSLHYMRCLGGKIRKNAILLPFCELFLQDPGSFNRWLAWSSIKSLTGALISIFEVVHSTRSRISDRNSLPSEIRLLDSYMSALGFMISIPNFKLDLCKFPCTL